jgi:electron transfer flavoprotein alpha subunit
MQGDIWVLAEHNGQEVTGVTLEILGEARKLALPECKVAAILLGHNISGLAAVLGQYGADKVYLVEHPSLQSYSTDRFLITLYDLIKKHEPSLFLCGASALGRDLAPVLASKLRTGLVTNCTILKRNAQGLVEMTRDSYRGKVHETRVCPSMLPQMATIKPGVIGIGKPNTFRKAEVVVESVTSDIEPIRTRSLGVVKADPKIVDVSEADVIVAAGRGVGDRKTFDSLQEMADLLCASMGGTRPAVDSGWIVFERQIGQTGKTVAPKLFIAWGISGATQHTMGMKDSRLIIAINSDRAASIFKMADVSILTDLRELLPALIEELRQVKSVRESNKEKS